MTRALAPACGADTSRRSVSVRRMRATPDRPPKRKAAAGVVGHVGAPMPGMVATVAVAAGDRIARGDVLITLEAMKLEMAVCADAAGEVVEVLVKPGQQVEAKDLLIVMT